MAASFERDLLFLIHDTARMLRVRVDQRARAYGMTRAQWVILARLERQPGISQNELAAACEVEPITIARLIDRLERHGLVERRADPADRRIRRLHLLAAAQPILAAMSQYREELNAQITGGIEGATRDALVDALLHIKDNLTTDDTGGERKLAVAGE